MFPTFLILINFEQVSPFKLSQNPAGKTVFMNNFHPNLFLQATVYVIHVEVSGSNLRKRFSMTKQKIP